MARFPLTPVHAVRPSPSTSPRRRAVRSAPLGRPDVASEAPDEGIVQMLTALESDAGVFRRYGDTRIATVLENWAREFSKVCCEFTQWLSEEAAARRSGWTTERVRRHAKQYRNTEHVRFKRSRIEVRACIIPRADTISNSRLDELAFAGLEVE